MTSTDPEQHARKLLDQMSDAELTALYDRAEQAEAALTRNREAAARTLGLLDEAGDQLPDSNLRDRICAALAEPKEPRP